MTRVNECFVSVDVETSGPIPGKYSLLQIGAQEVYGEQRKYSCFVKPVNENAVDEALRITGLSMETLTLTGVEPQEAMHGFEQWLLGIAAERPVVFVGFNSPFDWSFVNYYFHCYLGRNPFGHSALDIKSLYMGKFGSAWSDTSADKIASAIKANKRTGRHDAAQDASFQAELFRLIRSRH